MSAANSRKSSPLQGTGFEWAGAAARIRRAGGTSRAGRRSALLSVLSSVYANHSRGTRTNETRTNNGADRS